MASLPLSSLPSQCSFLPSTLFKKPLHSSTCKTPITHHQLEVSCNDKKVHTPQPNLDRRNLLIGIGGLYGGAATLHSPAYAAPISAPDISKCTKGTNLNTSPQQPLDFNCCPPPAEIYDYVLPPVTTMRVRPAAQLATPEYIAKYEKAIALMKALPSDDPRNFMQQANVHCAYCNLAYEQSQNDPNLKLQIHFCWLFFPWHRWYLYFYERILAKLIDDPTFTLPFWNWDSPPGMQIPSMFNNPNSPLYDTLRNPDHRPPALVDLKYSEQSPTPPDKIISSNLQEMYREMVSSGTDLEAFYGDPYVVGSISDNQRGGNVELGSHTSVHLWTGQTTGNNEDMGNFFSAGRDPIFFAHHANVDRLWSIWRNLIRGTKPQDLSVCDRLWSIWKNIDGSGSRPTDFKECDWLCANFLFYDEDKRLVRVYVGDAVDHEKMGYTFQQVEIPWLKSRPTAKFRRSKVATTSKAPKAAEVSFPVKLDKVVKVVVDRPTRKRSKEAKEREEEALVIEGIEVEASKAVRFEVYVNDEDDKPEDLIDKAEYAGCYAHVSHKNSSILKTKIRLGLTELLEDLDVEDDDKILVSLVPKTRGEDITIGGIKIVYVDRVTSKVNYFK